MGETVVRSEPVAVVASVDSTWMSGPYVGFFSGSWIGGTRAVQYFGSVAHSIFVPDVLPGEYGSRSEYWEASYWELLDQVGARIRVLGGNAGVSADMSADPGAVDERGAPGVLLSMVCTAARLAPLFG